MTSAKESPLWLWPADLENEFEGANDRAIAIIAASFLETILVMVLEDFLIDHKSASKIFEHYKPLDTFAAKIHMSFCLGLISETEFRNLEVIRSIRNTFAHDLRATSFENQSIKDGCAKLQIPQGMYIPSKIPLPVEGKPVEIDLTPPGSSMPRELFRAAFSYLHRSLSWRWIEARRQRRKPPEDLHSATECMRNMLTEFDILQKQLNVLKTRAEALRRETHRLQEEGKLPEDHTVLRELSDLSEQLDMDATLVEEPDLVSLFEIARPLVEYSIEVLERAYGRNSDNSGQ